MADGMHHGVQSNGFIFMRNKNNDFLGDFFICCLFKPGFLCNTIVPD
jgi:hypothetical protein